MAVGGAAAAVAAGPPKVNTGAPAWLGVPKLNTGAAVGAVGVGITAAVVGATAATGAAPPKVNDFDESIATSGFAVTGAEDAEVAGAPN